MSGASTDPRPVEGARTIYVEGAISPFTSTIDPSVNNLSLSYCYDVGLGAAGDLPVVLIMGGYASPGAITQAHLRRMASYGLVSVSVGPRTRDASAREIHDLIDAVAQVRAAIPAVASQSKAAIVGYSGGGGQVLACAHKVPDFFTTYASFFGIADYGYDSIDGWWFTRSDTRALLAVDVADRLAALNPYRAREAVGSIGLALRHGGAIYLFHDTADGDVTVANSRRVAEALEREGSSRFAYAESAPGDAVRWLHGLPDAVPGLIEGEWRFVRHMRSAAAWSMPARASLRVAGWHKSSQIEIWLGDGAIPKATLTDGKQHAADVDYDLLTGIHRVRPLTGVVRAQIIQGARQRIVQLAAEGEVSMSSIVTDAWAAAADLPGCVLSLEADTGVGLAGADVTSWADQSAGGANDYTAGAATATFEAAFEGGPALRWQGAASQYLSGPVILDPNEPYMMAFAIRAEASTVIAWSQCNSASFGANRALHYHANTVAVHQASDSSGNTVETVAATTPLAWHFVAMWRDDAGRQYVQVDDSVVDSDPVPSGSIAGTNRSALGCLCDSPGFWTFGNMRLRAVCGVAGRAPYDDERAKLRNFWKAKYPGMP